MVLNLVFVFIFMRVEYANLSRRRQEHFQSRINLDVYTGVAELMDKHVVHKAKKNSLVIHESGLGHFGADEPGIFIVVRSHGKKIKHVFLSDVNEKPLEKAREAIKGLPEELRKKVHLAKGGPHKLSPAEKADVTISSWVTWPMDFLSRKEHLKNIVDATKPGGFVFLDRHTARDNAPLLHNLKLERLDKTREVHLFRKKL